MTTSPKHWPHRIEAFDLVEECAVVMWNISRELMSDQNRFRVHKPLQSLSKVAKYREVLVMEFQCAQQDVQKIANIDWNKNILFIWIFAEVVLGDKFVLRKCLEFLEEMQSNRLIPLRVQLHFEVANCEAKILKNPMFDLTLQIIHCLNCY